MFVLCYFDEPHDQLSIVDVVDFEVLVGVRPVTNTLVLAHTCRTLSESVSRFLKGNYHEKS